MKSMFTLLLATALTSSAFAYDGGRLSVTLPKSNLTVVIDNRTYAPEDNSVVMNNIPVGQHSIQVYRSNGVRRNRNNDLLYSSTVYVKPNYHVDVMINRFGKALVDERDLRDRNNGWDDGDGY